VRGFAVRSSTMVTTLLTKRPSEPGHAVAEPGVRFQNELHRSAMYTDDNIAREKTA